jgi:hypothetical protein
LVPHNRYTNKLSHQQIICLFDHGVYHCDLETGLVYSTRTAIKLFTFEGNEDGYLWVRLYYGQSMRSMSVSHVVWIVGTRCAIPEGFEIHHRDKDIKNNRFDNLFCLHRIDHNKLHHGQNLITEDTPF